MESLRHLRECVPLVAAVVGVAHVSADGAVDGVSSAVLAVEDGVATVEPRPHPDATAASTTIVKSENGPEIPMPAKTQADRL